MSGPTPFSQDGLPLFTEERPAVVILGDLLDYIQEMRQLYDDTQELYKVLQDNLSFIGSGSPKGVYASLSALQAAKPTGDTFIYVTTDNGNWYYWNGTAWVSGGVYQASQSLTNGFSTFFVSRDGNLMNFDDVNKVLNIPLGMMFLKKSAIGVTSRNVDLTKSFATDTFGVSVVTFNTSTNNFNVYKQTETNLIPDNETVICSISVVAGKIKNVTANFGYKINNIPFIQDGSVTPAKVTFNNGFYGLYVPSTGNINVDTVARNIVVPAGYLLIKKNLYFSNGGTYDISGSFTESTYTGVLLFNTTTSTYRFVSYNGLSGILDNEFFVAILNTLGTEVDVTSPSIVTVNGKTPISNLITRRLYQIHHICEVRSR